VIKKLFTSLIGTAAEQLEKGNCKEALHIAGIVYATMLNVCAMQGTPKVQAELLMGHITLTTKSVFAAARKHSKIEVSAMMQQILDDMDMWSNSMKLETEKLSGQTVPEMCFKCDNFYKECLAIGFMHGKTCLEFKCQSASNE
jgi:hypothetical protein